MIAFNSMRAKAAERGYMSDEEIEVAKFCGAVLVTGNIKHFPQKPFIMTVSDFLERYN